MVSPGVSLSLCPRAHPSPLQGQSLLPLRLYLLRALVSFPAAVGKAPVWLEVELWGAGWLRAELHHADLV